MKVLHLNAFELKGGAAIAAHRLHRGLLDAGVDSELLVQFRSGKQDHVHAPTGKWGKARALLHDTLEPLPLLRYPGRQTERVFSANWFGALGVSAVRKFSPDLVHLHWVHAGMLSVSAIGRLGVPVVWTLHDMWPFTGGCHYAGDCAGYRRDCGACPQLGSDRPRDLSHRVQLGKIRHWRNADIHAVAPSQWLADCASASRVFAHHPVTVIPNGLDLDRWRPVDQQQARQLLGLPDGPVLLFTAARGLASPYKGGAQLLSALQALWDSGQRFSLLLMGDSGLPAHIRAPFPVFGLGSLHDDISRVLAYSAADATMHMSSEDNLPNTVAESLACGTPVVARRIGGLPEMIRDRHNGVLVDQPGNDGFVEALTWLLGQADLPAMRDAARRSARLAYDLADVSARYRALYEEVLQGQRGDSQ